MRHAFVVFGFCVLAGTAGCMWDDPKPKAEDKKGIFGKTTQDIGQFDKDAEQKVSDQKINATDPVTAPLAAYGPMVEKLSIIQVEHAVNLFYASEGRYPKDYAEFMERIIKENNIKLPVLPYKGQYKYDEATHSLVCVYPEPPPADAKKP